MATRYGVGGINEPVKLLDEYQLQVPLHYRKVWEFDTIAEAEAFMESQKGRVFDGHEYKKAVKDDNGDKVKDENGDTVYKPVLNENGKIQIQYCPVGEMVVKCVEKAARIMGSPVHITGAYLTGNNWADCH